MFDDNPETKWFREFHELGVERVRGAVNGGGWDREKRQAARRWLERQDMKVWQAGRKDLPSDRPSFKERMRKSKVWLYAMGAIGFMIIASRIGRFW